MAKKRAKSDDDDIEETPKRKARKRRSAPANKKARKARRAARRSNPEPAASIVGEITGVLLPGFAAFAATKTISRLTYQLVGKKWPKLAKHANVLAGMATFGAFWSIYTSQFRMQGFIAVGIFVVLAAVGYAMRKSREAREGGG